VFFFFFLTEKVKGIQQSYKSEAPTNRKRSHLEDTTNLGRSQCRTKKRRQVLHGVEESNARRAKSGGSSATTNTMTRNRKGIVASTPSPSVGCHLSKPAAHHQQQALLHALHLKSPKDRLPRSYEDEDGTPRGRTQHLLRSH